MIIPSRIVVPMTTRGVRVAPLFKRNGDHSVVNVNQDCTEMSKII